MNKTHKKSDQYDDLSHNYLRYWDGREYENAAEEMAIRRLLKNKHFNKTIDVGGGYGRLSVLLEEFANEVTLVEPSRQQLDIADEFLKDHPGIDKQLMQADDLKFDDGSVDLAIMVRVMHHLPDPSAELKEIHRVLADNGLFILEVANYSHFRNRMKYFMRGKLLPKQPVDIRSAKNKLKDEIKFVNHNPKTVTKQLAHAGFKVIKTLSVSNLRSPTLKKIIPRSGLLMTENILQPTLSKMYFGPSVFFLVKKAN